MATKKAQWSWVGSSAHTSHPISASAQMYSTPAHAYTVDLLTVVNCGLPNKVRTDGMTPWEITAVCTLDAVKH